MAIKYYSNIEQGSDDWLEMRKGVLTASEMKHIITPTLKVANNERQKLHAFEIASQRINDYIEPQYINDDMLRGQADEVIARDLYSEHYAPVKEMGFVVNDNLGFKIGYSPDGFVGDDGLLEIKSRMQKHHLKVMYENQVPEEHYIQLQTGLYVTGRKWIDYVSFCAGMPLFVIRVLPDERVFAAIEEASKAFELAVNTIINKVKENLSGQKIIQTERLIEDTSDVVLF